MVISGNITKIIHKKDNFIIFRVNDKIVVKTYNADKELDIDRYIEAVGNFEISKYGRVFEAESIKVSVPPMKHMNLLPIYVSGLGEKKAEEIKKALGDDYIEKLSENPKLIFDFYLSENVKNIYKQWQEVKNHLPNSSTLIPEYLAKKIKGLGIKKATEWFRNVCDDSPENIVLDKYFYKYWASETAQKVYEQVKMLQKIISGVEEIKSLGYSERIIPQLVEKYKDSIVETIKENPYIPFKRYNVPFEECDEIAVEKLHVGLYDKNRVINAVIDVLQKVELEGSSFIHYDSAIEEIAELLKLDDKNKISEIVQKDARTKKSDIYIEEDRLYRKYVYLTEKNIGEILKMRIKQPDLDIPSEIQEYLASTKLTKEQQDCVLGVLKSNVSILTGGPGTGKTTCLKAVCAAITKMGKTYALAAPTGRASKRITETTGKPAKTLHRLLEYKHMGCFGVFLKNNKNKLNYDYIIVDETSMIDIFLMNALLKATSLESHIILVGDVDQLPSVSMGSILRDLKDSGVIPIYALTQIHRQSKSSYIIQNAYHVKNGEKIAEAPHSDFLSLKINSVDELMRFLQKLISKGKTFQILCPTKIGTFGTEVLNEFMQRTLNKDAKKSITYNNRLFKVNDKVIQTVNDYEKEVFNGEMGTIVDIGNDSVIIDFPQNTPSRIKYTKRELANIDLAYAITIHKAQGSEFDNVVIMMGNNNEDFLTRELLYTGITRAKKGLIFLATKELEFYQSLPIGNARATNLCNLLSS